MTELCCVACHMGSHSVNCHLAQTNTPRLTQLVGLVLDLLTLEGWKNELT